MARQYFVPGRGAFIEKGWPGQFVPGWGVLITTEPSPTVGTANPVTTVLGSGIAGSPTVGEADGVASAAGAGGLGSLGSGAAAPATTAAAFGFGGTQSVGMSSPSTNVAGSGCSMGSLYTTEIGLTGIYITEELSCGAHPAIIFAPGAGNADGSTTALAVVTPGSDLTFELMAII